MEFEIRMDYTIEDFAAFWYGFIRKKAGRPLSRSDDPPKWARALGRVCAWFFLAMGVLSIVNSLIQGRRMYMEEMGFLWNLFLTTPLGGLLEIAFGSLALRSLRMAPASYLLRPPYARWVRRAWKKQQSGGAPGVCCFTEDGCWVHEAKSDSRCDYDYLDNLWEDEEHYYLELPKRRFYILPKRNFTAGAPEDLPAFWTAQTGKPVRQATPLRK